MRVLNCMDVVYIRIPKCLDVRVHGRPFMYHGIVYTRALLLLCVVALVTLMNYSLLAFYFRKLVMKDKCLLGWATTKTG